MGVLYIPWSRAIGPCYKLASMLLDASENPDIIVTISRGPIPARKVSDVLGIDKLVVIRSKHWGIAGRLYDKPRVYANIPIDINGKNVLVVNEVVDTGQTISEIVNILKSMNASSIKTAVLHYKTISIFEPDYYVEKIDEWAWIFYPWSFVETLYGLSIRHQGELFQNSMRLLSEVGANEFYLDPLRIKSHSPVTLKINSHGRENADKDH